MRFGKTLIFCLSFLLLPLMVSFAQESPPSEYQLKAAFLFNFAKFVDWPPEAFTSTNAPMVIGILGEDPFGPDLENTIHNKSIAGRAIVHKRVTSLAEARSCHILFISSSEKKRLPEIFGNLRGASVLTVSETDTFTELGGMINFVMEGKKIRFQINDDAAKSAGLKISSKLLGVALHVAKS